MKYNELTLGQIEAIVNKLGGIEGAKAFLQGTVEIVVKPIIKPIIHWFGTTETSATTENFAAKNKFRKDSKEVKFYEIWEYFAKRFLAGNGKIEEPLNGQELRYGNLTKSSVDGPIIEELGGEAKAETTLTELWDLLKKQANGEEGDLMTGDCSNIFYIRDITGALISVRLDWGGGGWEVYADRIDAPESWPAGTRIFSRHSTKV